MSSQERDDDDEVVGELIPKQDANGFFRFGVQSSSTIGIEIAPHATTLASFSPPRKIDGNEDDSEYCCFELPRTFFLVNDGDVSSSPVTATNKPNDDNDDDETYVVFEVLPKQDTEKYHFGVAPCARTFDFTTMSTVRRGGIDNSTTANGSIMEQPENNHIVSSLTWKQPPPTASVETLSHQDPLSPIMGNRQIVNHPQAEA
eukprot:scaffold2903_cov170-Amphora_coffeaeformis.AAC.6